MSQCARAVSSVDRPATDFKWRLDPVVVAGFAGPADAE
jgi:hypothetical protein